MLVQHVPLRDYINPTGSSLLSNLDATRGYYVIILITQIFEIEFKRLRVLSTLTPRSFYNDTAKILVITSNRENTETHIANCAIQDDNGREEGIRCHEPLATARARVEHADWLR